MGKSALATVPKKQGDITSKEGMQSVLNTASMALSRVGIYAELKLMETTDGIAVKAIRHKVEIK